ncbi:coiled-coil domain-containing protein 137 [Corythoichthys intestinalis]|uniref:coiled-coil domain-containing protein 137 n=1 Tax=Corythoichthys intestinalis TaxID=161448 RepID=UPI0025A68E2E|nr:coiled-coil domain-containing protein 137 [Corythoichthys intestinalis]
MGKKTKRKAGNPLDKTGQQQSAKKQKRNVKAKKDNKQEDHLEHIPFRLQEIMKSKERMKSASSKGKKHATVYQRQPEKSEIGDIAVPNFKRGKKETVKHFLQRMEIESRHVLFLTENQVDRKPELDEDKQEKPADQGKSEKKKEHDKLRLQKRQLKKLERQEDRMEKQMFQDDIPFGEVSMEPPSLTSKPKKVPIKPQASKELLLNSLLGNATSTAKPSMARQRIMEEERQRAVLAYRQLKQQRQQQLEEARTVKRKGHQ